MSAVRKRLLDLLAMFASKAGGILVNLVFLPWYHRLLSPAEFGVVAMILSLQALLIVLDLGIATLASRDAAAMSREDAGTQHAAWNTWRAGERLLGLIYGGALLLALAATSAARLQWGAGALTPWHAAGTVLLLGVLVQHNLTQTVLIGAHRFRTASLLQLLGSTMRAGLTTVALYAIDASLDVFLAVQSCAALLHWLATRACATAAFAPALAGRHAGMGIGPLWKRARSLALFGAAGALTMQLDKPILLLQLSAEAVGPYFLATTFALTPIAVLAGPVAQYFQPFLVRHLGTQASLAGEARRFATVIVATLVGPCFALWVHRDTWLELWLHDKQTAATVAHLGGVLLPATVVGALGYIPNALLVVRQDFLFLGRMATAMALVLLPLVFACATAGSLDGVVFSYAGYHLISTAALWARAFALPEVRTAARAALQQTVLAALATISSLAAVLMLLRPMTSALLEPQAFAAAALLLTAGIATVLLQRTKLH